MNDKLIFSDHRFTAYKNGDLLKLFYHTPHSITISIKDHKEIDNEIIRMLKMKSEDEKKIFIQQDAAKVIGLSRQMINRRWKIYKNDGLSTLLSKEKRKIKVTSKMLDRITQLYSENIFYTSEKIISKLINEGYCKSLSEGSIRYAMKKIDSMKLVKLLRHREKKIMPKLFMDSEYLFEKLFKIIETLFKKIPIVVRNKISSSYSYDYLKSCYRKIKNEIKKVRTKDKYTHRVKLNRDRRRNIGYIARLINNIKSLLKKCPDCNKNNVSFVFKRKRYYTNKEGVKKESFSEIYKCNNDECKTKYFTVPPKGVELYARVHTDIKKMVFRWSLHLRGTLSRVCDELSEHGTKVAVTTISRWLKKAGEECPDMNKISTKDKSQSLCIDEKWIKIRNEWKYIFTATNSKTSDLIAMELYHQKDKSCIKSFLISLKMAGYNPYSITTDLLLGYENIVKKIFPDSIYNNCVLHAEKDAKKLIRKHIPDNDKYEEIKKILKKRIRVFFESKKLKQAKKRYYKIMMLKEKVPKRVYCLFRMLKKYFPKLCNIVTNKQIPRTTNAVERAIGEFEEKYHLTKGFTNFYFARFYIKLFQVYYCFRKITFGRFKNKNRLELKNDPIGKLKFTDYLTPTYH